MRLRIGIDLGGTKIAGIALDEAGAVLAERRVLTPREDYSGTLQAIVDLVEGLEIEAGATGTVGLGMPGAISPVTGLVKNANSTWLNERPFATDVAALLGRPVRVENDANCLAVSEAVDGAAAQTIERYRDRLGRSIAHVVNILDPDAIVLGGGLSTVPEIAEDLFASVAPHVFSDGFDTPIVPSLYGDASGVRGAAWLWDADTG